MEIQTSISVQHCEKNIAHAKTMESNESTQAYIKNQIEQLELCKSLISLADEFKARSYPDRLKFWTEHDLHPYNISYTLFENKESKGIVLDIYPEPEFYEVYYDWKVDQLIKLYPNDYDLNIKKENYYSNIPKSANAVLYTEKELKKCTDRINTFSKRISQPLQNPFLLGFNSAVDGIKPDFNAKGNIFALRDINQVLEGIVSAHYQQFLKTQLLLRQKEEATLTDTLKEQDLASVTPQQENQKVMLLYELGIIDFLKERYQLDNETKLAQIIESFSGIKQDTIRQTYRAIKGTSNREGNNPYNSTKNEAFIVNAFNQLGLIRKPQAK